MKAILLIGFVISIMVLVGCSDNKDLDRRPVDWQGNSHFSTEEMEKMQEERKQLAIKECIGKEQGALCTIESPRGEMEGKCQIIEGDLSCTTNRSVREFQRR